MSKSISTDLRERIIDLWKEGQKTYEDLAEHFSVGRATVSRLLRRFRETGGVEPLPHGGGMPRSIPVEEENELKVLIEEQSDRTLQELAELYTTRTGVSVSRATSGRMMVRLGYSRKKRLWSLPSENVRASSRNGRRSSRPPSRSMARDSSSSTSPARTSR